jgi:hypothetical protein
MFGQGRFYLGAVPYVEYLPVADANKTLRELEGNHANRLNFIRTMLGTVVAAGPEVCPGIPKTTCVV